MATENWRTQIDARDYFGNQKKRVEIEQRRPTIRKAADLVGPGIGAEAVRLDDYNDLLATFNGYYSSAAGALNAPNATEAFVGQVVSDAVFGGRQIFTGLTSGTEYSRTFTRSPVDPESIGWGLWRGQRIPPSVVGYTGVNVVAPSGSMTILWPPGLSALGDASVYDASPAGIRIRKQGVYTGSIQVGCTTTGTASVVIQRPNGATTTSVTHASQLLGPSVYYPFTVWATDELQGFSVSVLQSSGSDLIFWWRFQCARIGDAV